MKRIFAIALALLTMWTADARNVREKILLNEGWKFTFGNAAVNVCEWWDKFASEQGVKQQYINSILMVDNYLPVFDMNQHGNLAKIISGEKVGTLVHK